MTTALELAQSAAVEMGLAPPASIYSTSELIPQQLGALLNVTGEMLVKRRVWRRLFRDTTVQTIVGQGTYPLPDDFARPITQTEWDRVNRWPLIGPETSQQWQWLKSGILSTGPRERFRLVGNALELWPVPAAGAVTTNERVTDVGDTRVTSDGDIRIEGSDTNNASVIFSYYYISKWWALSPSGDPKKKCDNDDDQMIFDDRLMISGIKLRFYQSKQFDTTSFAAEFQSNLDDAIAQDSGGPILSMARQPAFPLITIYNIPDGNWMQQA
jgi:hypothetical protein